MRTQAPEPGGPLAATFRGEAYSPGGDVSAAERARLREQNAARFLVAALVATDAWWRHVDAVRGAADPERVADERAKLYAARRRRRSIVVLLLRAAGGEADRASMTCRMFAATSVAAVIDDQVYAKACEVTVSSPEEAAAQAVQHPGVRFVADTEYGPSTHYSSPPTTATAQRSTYRMGEAFALPLARAARAVAARGGNTPLSERGLERPIHTLFTLATVAIGQGGDAYVGEPAAPRPATSATRRRAWTLAASEDLRREQTRAIEAIDAHAAPRPRATA